MTRLKFSRLRSLWGNHNFDFAVSLARGFSGGIISLWDPFAFSRSDIWCDDNYVIIKGRWIREDLEVFMVNVYAPQHVSDKSILWQKLSSFMAANVGKYILFGDWNAVRNEGERCGSEFCPLDTRCFNEFIEQNVLYEIPLGGLQFTWRNKAGTKFSKLDRFFVTNDIFHSVDDLKGVVMPRGYSDHSPIILYQDKVDFGPTYFKVCASWFSRSDFDSTVLEAWVYLESDQDSNIVSKFRRLKAILKSWIHTCRSSEVTRLKELEKKSSTLIFLLTGEMLIELFLITSTLTMFCLMWKRVILREMLKIQKLDVQFGIAVALKLRVPLGSNSAFFYLLPKVKNPVLVTDFRLISLVGFFYKIVTNRLLLIINKIISPVQSAFISRRQILDGPLMLSEIMSWYKKTNRHMLLFKVDFEKAYDSFNWDYLLFLLSSLGFGNKWRGWILGCLKSARTSVLVNGSPTRELQIKRGLRQGDPLNPFLFIIVMEGLHLTINRAMERRFIRGINVGNISHSHFMYADDVIIFSD
ncbi:uncharacterized protein [Rutidosis leptorrhynchoides]|uniref:uncharacterized protein n=1 Tax=Rutidosis leptorrhynchoides TaxID=125765 RepID=UPI003A993A01